MSWPVLWILSKNKTGGSRSKWNTSHIHFYSNPLNCRRTNTGKEWWNFKTWHEFQIKNYWVTRLFLLVPKFLYRPGITFDIRVTSAKAQLHAQSWRLGVKKIHGFHKLRPHIMGMFFQNSEVPNRWTAPILRMKFLLHVPFLQHVGRKFDSWHEEDWRLGFLPTLSPNGLCWGLLRPKSFLKSMANVCLCLWRQKMLTSNLVTAAQHGNAMVSH